MRLSQVLKASLFGLSASANRNKATDGTDINSSPSTHHPQLVALSVRTAFRAWKNQVVLGLRGSGLQCQTATGVHRKDIPGVAENEPARAIRKKPLPCIFLHTDHLFAA